MVRIGAFGRGRGAAELGRLRSRPAQPTSPTTVGLQPLDLESWRDRLLYVPAGYGTDRPAPLAVLLHGAGGEAEHAVSSLQPLADAAGVILLAPISRRQTWYVILGGFGPDVAFLDRALEHTFTRSTVDPASLAVGSIWDGASYALSLGLTNGDLFTHVLAFSPGFALPGVPHGELRLFLSHGTQDEMLPIDSCSRRIVPRLERAGYDVTYCEFEGPHTLPPEIAREAVDWFFV